MKVAIAAVSLAVLAAPHAAANEAHALELKPKAAIAAASPVPAHTAAPFTSPVNEAELDFTPAAPEPRHMANSSCGLDRPICYDMTSGHIVFKPARALMPDIPGLTRENISVKRDRIILRYTF
ncbi:MAG TPA: hypothetical protein VHQ02_01525 [Usitatibacter sp.]|jgi:hypothetical protein|nr:hypothetical protein [Usitatibacter sp.]